ncbi:MAG: outer membrane beta-barrel protein [Janthinobacterium lividum]
MRNLLLSLASLASLPTLSLAQSAPTSGFYLGLGPSVLTSKPFNSQDATALVGPALTGGLQVTPHVALQLSAAYGWKNTTTAYTYYYPGSTIASVNSGDEHLKVYTFPLLVRVTLTAPTSRVHADVLGGVTYLHSTSHEVYTSTLSGQVTRQDENAYATNRANVTLGPAIRYAFTPRWEVAANALVNYEVVG